MQVDKSYSLLPKQKSVRASIVMDHFGIDLEQGPHVIGKGLEIPVQPGQIVLFTGESGSGKSSLLREVVKKLKGDSQQVESNQTLIEPGTHKSPSPLREMAGVSDSQSEPPLEVSPSSVLRTSSPRGEKRFLSSFGNNREHKLAAPQQVLNLDDIELGEDLIIDRMPGDVSSALQLLASCGLAEAQLLLRTPQELSDGQRYRFRLALGLRLLDESRASWLVNDEFTATLDRRLAKVIASSLRRTCDHTGQGFLLATTHDDVTDDLNPDVHVHCRVDGQTNVTTRDENGKKKDCHSSTTCGSPQPPNPIGRTSLGGITAATNSP